MTQEGCFKARSTVMDGNSSLGFAGMARRLGFNLRT
jgi:hypothetical protein